MFQIRAKWHPQYFFRWNAVDSHVLHDGYIPKVTLFKSYSSLVEFVSVFTVVI